MSLVNFNLNSDYKTDRLIGDVITGSRSVPAYTYFDTFTVANPFGVAFIPFIRYSVDGGMSWYENGTPVREVVSGSTLDGVSINARCNNSVVEMIVINSISVARTALWEVYGVTLDV